MVSKGRKACRVVKGASSWVVSVSDQKSGGMLEMRPVGGGVWGRTKNAARCRLCEGVLGRGWRVRVSNSAKFAIVLAVAVGCKSVSLSSIGGKDGSRDERM